VTEKEIRQQGGKLFVGARLFGIPNLTIETEIGEGANGVVFKAKDDLLGRSVALKVWKERGRARAQQETSKIALITHPLVVTTFSYGVIDEHPYAIMELIEGESGKSWLASNPSLEERFAAWKLYSRALAHIHGLGMLHGDPHLGNMLMFRDDRGAYVQHDWRGDPSICLKLADTGTSEFWLDKGDFAEREARLIEETAARIFRADRYSDLVDQIGQLGPALALRRADAIVGFVGMQASADWDWRAHAAERIASVIVETPAFNLDGVLRHVKVGSVTTVERLCRRLNARLLGIADVLDAPDRLTKQSREAYARRRIEWLGKIATD
jgi:serine/threonine protein kinase